MLDSTAFDPELRPKGARRRPKLPLPPAYAEATVRQAGAHLRRPKCYAERARVGHSLFTEAEDIETLHKNLKDAVRCHFEEQEREEQERPKLIRLHLSKEEVIAA